MAIPTPTPKIRPHQGMLILATIVAIASWVVPILNLVLLPLQYLNTHLHEFSHALMGVLTGGSVDHIQVHTDGSGLTFIYGGIGAVFSAAGYVGAALIGALMILLGSSTKGARWVLGGLAILLSASMAFWVRGDLVGVLAGIFWIAILLAGVRYLRDGQAMFAAQFLGVQQCLTSIQSFLVLLHISAFTGMQSDAQNMQDATGIPALFWALAWFSFSVVLMWATLRRAWHSPPTPSA